MFAHPTNAIRICLIVVCAQFAFTVAGYGQVPITFQGHVKYSTGEPVAGATVTMTVRFSGETIGTETAATDGSGNYTFQSSHSNPPCNPNEWSFKAFIALTVDDEPLPPSNTASSSGCVGPGTVTLGHAEASAEWCQRNLWV